MVFVLGAGWLLAYAWSMTHETGIIRQKSNNKMNSCELNSNDVTIDNVSDGKMINY